MTKALTVLASCLDIRNGKRFEKGDVFDPTPTYEQAVRLVSAGCLPQAALELAEKADSDAEATAAAAAVKRKEDEAAAAKLVTARTEKATADQAVEAAQTKLAAAADGDAKAAAAKELKQAEAAAKTASAELEKLTK